MRYFALIAIPSLFFLSGCGCIEKHIDPRFNDGPLVNETSEGIKVFHPRGPAVTWPDGQQPGWHRFLFGTRWLYPYGGQHFAEDPNQPAWQRQLFGPRHLRPGNDPAPVHDPVAFLGTSKLVDGRDILVGP